MHFWVDTTDKRHFEFLQATGSPKMIPVGFLNLTETELKFLRVFFPHCNNPESTSNFEAVTSGSWPGCCLKLTLQGSRWKRGLAQGRERLSASSNARKKIGLRKDVCADSTVCLMSRRSFNFVQKQLSESDDSISINKTWVVAFAMEMLER